MSQLELEVEEVIGDTDVPEIIHLTIEEADEVALCGTRIDLTVEVFEDEGPDCVVCLAEAQRLNITW